MKLIFEISQDMSQALDKIQQKRELSRSSVCRLAISKFLEHEGISLGNQSAE